MKKAGLLFFASFMFCASVGAVSLPNPQLVSGPYSEPLSILDVLNYNYTQPADQPTPPGDTFVSPGTTFTPGGSVPKISNFTPQSKADRSIVLLGSGLENPIIHAYQQTTSSDGQNVELDALVREADGTVAVFPTNCPYGMWMVWAENASGASWPMRVNATEAWWAGPEYAQAGESLSVYGRNLSHDNGTSQSWVYLRPWGSGSSSNSLACTVTEVNPFRVTFTVPSSLPADADYELWVHNGHGGQYGWSGPLKIRIESTPRYQWAGTVRTVAAPSGGDDASTIQTVLNAAQAGDRVLLQSGTYLIGSQLTAPAGISFEGAGISNTTVKTTAGFSAAQMLRIYPGASRVRDLTFEATVNVSQQLIEGYGYGADPVPAGMIFENIRTISLTNTLNAGITANFSKDVYVRNCEFIGGVGVWGCKVHQLFVQNNQYIGNATAASLNGAGNAYKFWSPREFDFSGNTSESLDRSQDLYARRAYIVQSPYGSSMDGYVGGNTSTDTGPLLGGENDNSGEQFLIETPHGAKFTDLPDLVGTTTLTFNSAGWSNNVFVTDDQPGWNNGEKDGVLVHILDGPGAGQWRRVLSNSTDTITVDRLWDVAPTTDSLISLMEGATRFAFYDNLVDCNIDDNDNDVPDFLERGTMATVGIALFGAMNDIAVVDNDISGVREGMFLYAFLDHPSHTVGVQVYGNSITNCRSGINIRPQSGELLEDVALRYMPLLMNISVRDNLLYRISEHALMLDDDTGFVNNTGTSYYLGGIWSKYNVLEANNVVDAMTGVRLGIHQEYTVVRGNGISPVSTTAGTVAILINEESQRPVLVDNLISADNETPLRVFGDENGLVASWQFRDGGYDGQWGDVEDVSHNNLNGCSGGGVSAVDGPGLGAARFDGTNGYVKADYPVTFDSFTVRARFKFNGPSSGANDYVFCSEGFGNTGVEGIGFFYGGYVVRIVGEDDTTGNSLQWDIRPFEGDGLWHDVTVTYDAATGLAVVYGDGVLRDSMTIALGKICPRDLSGAPLPYMIGARCDVDNFFNGDIAEVSIWNRSLSAGEITGAPLAHWKLNAAEWTGLADEVRDSGTAGYHGFVRGNAQTTTGKVARCGQFDGTNTTKSCVEIPYSVALSNFSLSAWFKVDGTGSGNSDYVFASDSIGNTDSKGLGLFYAKYIVRITGDQGTTGNSLVWDIRPFYGDDIWHHVAVTYDAGSGLACVYGDGVLRDSMTVTLGQIQPQDRYGNLKSWFIGSRNAADNFFNGRVDEVTLWDRAISSNEVVDIYSGPVAYWKFDETGYPQWPGDVRDSAFGGLHAFSAGGVGSVTGKVERAARFDGANDQVLVDYPLEFDSFTLSSVFRINGAGSGNSDYIFASDAIANTGCKGIGLFYGKSIVKIEGTQGSVGNNLTWNVSPFSGDGLWHQVVVTYDAAAQVARVYGDGVLRDTVTNVTLGKIKALNAYGYPVPYWIGSRTAADNFLNGDIDEFRLWDRALSTNEIATLWIP